MHVLALLAVGLLLLGTKFGRIFGIVLVFGCILFIVAVLTGPGGVTGP
jgi:hypothetical protein